jgi:hypothetical protein
MPRNKKTCYLRKGVIKKEAPAAIQTKRRRSDTRKTRKERKAQAAKTAVEMMSKGELGMQQLPRWKSNTIGRVTRSQNAMHSRTSLLRKLISGLGSRTPKSFTRFTRRGKSCLPGLQGRKY